MSSETTAVASRMEDLKVGESGEARKEEVEEEGEDDLIVDPWTVATSSSKGVDYDKLISKHDPKTQLLLLFFLFFYILCHFMSCKL